MIVGRPGGGKRTAGNRATRRVGRSGAEIARLGGLLLAAGCVALPASAPDGPGAPGSLVATLVLREPFGVGHPRQLLAFSLPPGAGPGPFRVIGPGGTESLHQVLGDGRLAVLSDLGAGEERRWTVYRGESAAGVAEGVRVSRHRAYYEITNGLTGVRVARFPGDLSRAPAPIQGLRHRDGTWTATGSTFLETPGGQPLQATAAGIRFLERGPLTVVVEVAYRLAGPSGAPGAAPGAGEYRSRIELQAGQPSVLVEDEADLDLRYRLDVSEGLWPDQARYRGHRATAPERGREPDGRRYRPGHERPPMDAVVDLPRPGRGEAFVGRLAVWDPWIADGGWYWQLYDSRGGPGANVLGVFAGRASRALGAAASGLRVVSGPAPRAGGRPPTGIVVELSRRAADGRTFPRVRVSWGVFLGVRGEDLRDPLSVQPIARQMHLHGGVSLQKLHDLGEDRVEGPGGDLGFYIDERRVARILDRVQGDDAYYRRLHDAEPTARPLLELWREPSDVRRRAVADTITGQARALLDALVNGDGIYDGRAGYWLGGLTMTRLVPWMHALLADPRTPPEDRARVLRVARLFGRLLWDDDLVPLFPGHGLHLGTENMPAQQREYRAQYALLLAGEPGMRERAAATARGALERVHAVIDETGAHMSSPHYVGASMGPLLTTLQQLQRRGVDLFAREPRLARFGEFYLGLLTPPEIRFGGRRKLIAVGDGSTESSELFGQLATAFAAADPALSARLMGAWRASGSRHSGFHGTTILKIDPDLPARDPALASASFPGWYSVLRSGWGTRDESALWLVHGTTYRDHYHDDNGSLVLYALGAPVSLDWGSTYSPRTHGAAMHSLVLPRARLGHPWDRGGAELLAAGARWGVDGTPRFAAFPHSGHAAARFVLDGARWRREVQLLHHDPGRPVVVVRDRLELAGAGDGGAVLSLNLAARGAVETPAGPLAPPPVDPQRGEPPSAGPVFALPAGWSRLGFTGQWGVDWDLHVRGTGPLLAQLGEWAHAWHPTPEADEFRRAQGRPFEERQHVLRLLGGEAFEMVMVPWRSGDSGAPVDVRQAGEVTELVRPGSRLWLRAGGHVFRGASRLVVTATGGEAVDADDVAVSGGPAEVAIDGRSVRVTLLGVPGLRRIALPAGCTLDGAAADPSGAWTVEHRGGGPVTVPGTCSAPDGECSRCGASESGSPWPGRGAARRGGRRVPVHGSPSRCRARARSPRLAASWRGGRRAQVTRAPRGSTGAELEDEGRRGGPDDDHVVVVKLHAAALAVPSDRLPLHDRPAGAAAVDEEVPAAVLLDQEMLAGDVQDVAPVEDVDVVQRRMSGSPPFRPRPRPGRGQATLPPDLEGEALDHPLVAAEGGARVVRQGQQPCGHARLPRRGDGCGTPAE